MHRLFLYSGIILSIVLITYALKANAQQKQVQKKYKVEQSIEWWSQTINAIEAAKTQLKQSDLPAKNVTYLSDSILAKIQFEITKQVQDQLNAEQKKDTSKPKK